MDLPMVLVFEKATMILTSTARNEKKVRALIAGGGQSDRIGGDFQSVASGEPTTARALSVRIFAKRRESLRWVARR